MVAIFKKLYQFCICEQTCTHEEYLHYIHSYDYKTVDHFSKTFGYFWSPVYMSIVQAV